MQIGLNNLGLTGNSPPFSPNYLFINNEVGDWWDASDTSLMYQDSAGTTAAAVNQPVGLMLGQRFKGQRGAERVVNGDFSAGAAGWSKDASVTISVGSASFAAISAGTNGVYRNIGFTAGSWYEVSVVISAYTAGNVTAWIGGQQTAASNPNMASAGTLTFKVQATALANGFIVVGSHGSAGTFTVTNISVREVPGIHRYQTTSANRPTLSARHNLLTKTDALDQVRGPGFTCTDGQADPLGRNKAVRVVWTAVANSYAQPSGFVAAAGTRYKSIGHVLGLGNSSRIRFLAGAGDSSSYAYVDINPVSGAFTSGAVSGGGNTVTLHSASVVVLSGGWYRIEVESSNSIAVAGMAAFFAASPDTNGDCRIFGVDCRTSADAALNIPAYQWVNTATDYDTAGFPTYLSYNGTNSWMQTSAVDFTGTDKMTVVGAWTKLSDAARGVVFELGNSVLNSIRLDAPVAAAASNYLFSSAGSVGASVTLSPYAAPITNVIAATGNISGDAARARANGGAWGESAADQGTGNYRNDVLYFGARGGTSLFFNGSEYISSVVGSSKTESLIARMERFSAAKAGIAL